VCAPAEYRPDDHGRFGMRLLEAHGFLFVTVMALGATFARAAVPSRESITRPEGPREYLVAVGGTNSTPRPLVILLHGHGGSARQVLGLGLGASPLAAWLAVGDREGLIVLAPDGSKGADGLRGWNDCRSDAASNPTTDDVGLIGALIDHEVAARRADPARIFAMGMSNGGMMTYRLAIEMPARLAAFATVGSSMAAKSRCPEPRVPVPALVIAGTADPLVPYGGGEVHLISRNSRGSVIAIDESVLRLRRLAGLSDVRPVTTDLLHRDPSDPTRAIRSVWGAPGSGPQVELLKIAGGGHVEPSPTRRIGWLYGLVVGAQNRDVESAEEAWAFFKDKRR
jgi:polyhydroxybutyrate depolymerase